MQAIEAGRAPVGRRGHGREPTTVDPELAADAVGHTFEVMAPARRSWLNGPAGAGERMRFRRIDGPGDWLVHFDGDRVHLADDNGRSDIELAGTRVGPDAVLRQRLPADRLAVTGDTAMARRYFTLVPPM